MTGRGIEGGRDFIPASSRHDIKGWLIAYLGARPFIHRLTSLTIGFIPLFAHFLMSAADPATGKTEQSAWTTDILFVAIATAGTSVATVFSRFAKGQFRTVRLGPAAIFLMTVTVALLIFAAMAYGAAACGHVSSQSLGTAVGLMIGTALASLSHEMGIATGLALSPLSETRA